MCLSHLTGTDPLLHPTAGALAEQIVALKHSSASTEVGQRLLHPLLVEHISDQVYTADQMICHDAFGDVKEGSVIILDLLCPKTRLLRERAHAVKVKAFLLDIGNDGRSPSVALQPIGLDGSVLIGKQNGLKSPQFLGLMNDIAVKTLGVALKGHPVRLHGEILHQTAQHLQCSVVHLLAGDHQSTDFFHGCSLEQSAQTAFKEKRQQTDRVNALLIHHNIVSLPGKLQKVGDDKTAPLIAAPFCIHAIQPLTVVIAFCQHRRNIEVLCI